MTLPALGRFHFSRAELWADGVIHVIGVVLGLGAVAALTAYVWTTAPLANLIPVSI
jgi:hemolysin III